MKKKTKIIILVVAIIIIALGLWGIYLITNFDEHTLVITKIDGELITAKSTYLSESSFPLEDQNITNADGKTITISEIKAGDIINIINGDITYTYLVNKIENNMITAKMKKMEYYDFWLKDANIKNSKGHKIYASDLKVGDTIQVINKKEKITTDLAESIDGYSGSTISNVTSVKVLDKKLEEYDEIPQSNMIAKKSAIVVKSGEYEMLVMGIDDTNELFSVNYPHNNTTNFEQGQEVLIYFDGNIAESYPAQINGAGKIEVLKGKNDIKIPDEILRYCYNSKDKITFDISKLTSTGISFTITDKNQIHYDFSSNEYTINKKNEEVEKKINHNNNLEENTVAGYNPDVDGILWEELPTISSIKCDDTVIENEERENGITKKILNWSKLYGELKERKIRASAFYKRDGITIY